MTTLTVKMVKERFVYDPDNGLLTYKEHTGMPPNITARLVGKIAGSMGSYGYIKIIVYGKTYLVHRLIWFLMKGAWPKEQIDHINGVRDDNRFVNLREATHTQNMRNRTKPSRNVTGFRGLYKTKSGRFVATISNGEGHQIHLGTFDTAEEAHEVYCAAVVKHYGEFASTLVKPKGLHHGR